MEQHNGARNKKLIWALEAHERQGRPLCNSCNDKLRSQRGCRKPGMEIEGQMAFRFTSQRLKAEDQILRECPVGKVLREFPYAFEAINSYHRWKDSGLDALSAPNWFQQSCAVIGAEYVRLEALAEQDRQTKRDASYMQRTLKARHG